MKAGQLYGPPGRWPNRAGSEVRECAGFRDYISLTLGRKPSLVDVFRLHVHLEIRAQEEFDRGNIQSWAQNSLRSKAILERGRYERTTVFVPEGWREYCSLRPSAFGKA